jgi:hypothetical protein
MPLAFCVVEIGLVLIGFVLTIAEFYVWHSGLLWHNPKRDPRNFPPPR